MNQSKYEKELRIGLVLYGGVSLAIYIYGVVYEFLRLVREEGAYARLIDEAKVKPVIDVISGSSAGGINGLFLAKALTTGGDLKPLKELWIQKGDLEALVNTDSKRPLSLLDSDYYERQLREALGRVRPDPTATESKRSINLLDLFITATNLDGIITEYGEPFCRPPIQSKYYGTVFHFKTRPGHYDLSRLLEDDVQQKLPQETSILVQDLLRVLKQEREEANDFDDSKTITGDDRDKNHYLARVAASTSSFPVAFQPVSFKKEDVEAMKKHFGAGVFKRDTPLVGVRQEMMSQSVVYGDGGMVNNKPFSQTLRTIFHRQADVPVDRKLFFIEPDPDTFSASNRLADQETIDGLHSLMSFFETTFYESISADLETLVERNQRIQNVREILTDFEGALAEYLTHYNTIKNKDETDRSLYESQPVYGTYRQIKVTALRKELEERLLGKADLSQLVAEAEAEWPEDLAQKSQAERELYVQDKLKKSFEDIISKEYEGLVIGQDISQFLSRFDYPFRIRRLRYFISKMNDWLTEVDLLPNAAEHPEQIESLRERLGTLKGKLYAFVEFYAHGAWLVWDQAPPITKQADLPLAFEAVSNSYRGLMDRRYKNLAFEMIGSDLADAIRQLEEIRPQPPYQIEDTRYYDVREKTAYLENMLNVCSEEDMTICMEGVFNSYEFLDMYLYPASILANIGEADPVEVIRISPKDATRYRTTVQDKLAGEKLMHFSAFLKRSWRENDLLWGRLDAAEIIVRSIFPDEAEANAILDELAPAIIKEELTSIRERRETEISQAIFSDQEQQQLKDILDQQTKLKQAEDVESYLKEYYTVGQEDFNAVSQTYLLRTLAKSLRTTSRLFEQRSQQNKRAGTGSPLNRPIQYLSAMLNLPYVFLVTLGGAEESQRRRLINYALTVAVVLFVLQLVGAIQATSWLLLGVIAFIAIYLQPKRLFGVIILLIALLVLLWTTSLIDVTVCSSLLDSQCGLE